MDDILNRLESKLDKQSDHLNSIDVTLARQNVTLEEHVRRTGLLEETLKEHLKSDEEALERLENQVKPLEQHRSMWLGAAKAMTVVATLAAIVEAFHLYGWHR